MARKRKPKKTVTKSSVSKKFDPHKFEKELLEKNDKKEDVKEEENTTQDKSSMVVYVGTAKRARRIGIYTGKEYLFEKDDELKPIPIGVDNSDLPALIQEKGKGCWRVEPTAIFILKEEWDKNCS
jgi:hypothetical protein